MAAEGGGGDPWRSCRTLEAWSANGPPTGLWGSCGAQVQLFRQDWRGAGCPFLAFCIHHGLANVWVSVGSQSGGTFTSVYTDLDGSYTVSGLPAGNDNTVCFPGAGATGGSSDAAGYLDQCYDNKPGDPAYGPSTPVSVTLGATTTGINAALVAVAAPLLGTSRSLTPASAPASSGLSR
jgi:hypothetical protein